MISATLDETVINMEIWTITIIHLTVWLKLGWANACCYNIELYVAII